MRRFWIGVMLSVSMVFAGCGGTKQTAGADVVRVLHSKSQSGAIVVNTQDVSENTTGEDVVDLNSPDGVRNYVQSKFPNQQYARIRVVRPNGTTSDLTGTASTDVGPSSPPPVAATPLPATRVQTANSISVPPPGCRLDPNLTPAASPNASRSAKANAAVSVATSKMGTPYIWGHSEDRGQYGFDCSNFTAYVYHHALGYIMSGASRTQNSSVGVRVPTRQMQVGDLLIFDSGAHVGIYAGGNQVIQEGGGLKQVGYLNIAPGKYWSKHITAVKRMF
jgi:cell wall-associated NlpC family hydrolase